MAECGGNDLTPELAQKAQARKSAEELLALAEENGVSITAEEARAYLGGSSRAALSLGDLGQAAGGAIDGKPTSGVVAVANAMAGRPLFASPQMVGAAGLMPPTVNDAIRRLEAAGAVKQVNAGKRSRAFEAQGVSPCSAASSERSPPLQTMPK